MPTLSIDVPDDVSRALSRQARALLLSQRRYVRAVLAAVAAQAELDAPSSGSADDRQPAEAAS
jgi:hypothetical protein